MNALIVIRKADDIQTFLPGIGEEEYQLRAKVGSMRNCAAAMIARTQSDTARALAWICSDYAVSYVYAGATHAELHEIGSFCNRLLITAMQAEAIDECVSA